jgi:type I restriction enzyme S subunit
MRRMGGSDMSDLTSHTVERYPRANCIAFRSTRERFGGLSNMAPGFPLRIGSVPIKTSEALYQACRFPHDPALQRMIVEQPSPMTAKMKSKPFRTRSRPDWDDIRVDVMRWCLRVKLAQNWETFGALLEETGERDIVEHSRRDRFWGATVDGETGIFVGQNVLGRLLMELREDLRRGKVGHVVGPPQIGDMRLLGETIGAVGPQPARNDEDLHLFDLDSAAGRRSSD